MYMVSIIHENKVTKFDDLFCIKNAIFSSNDTKLNYNNCHKNINK